MLIAILAILGVSLAVIAVLAITVAFVRRRRASKGPADDQDGERSTIRHS